ncbi:PEP-CTERM sorting domain-containing protein [Massilia sp. B-10]|nr:PEP-CTERM sorting domain-containing protein [Massilia sp. B-10]
MTAAATQVPELSSIALLALGLAAIAFTAKRARQV